MLQVTERWQKTYPRAMVGLIVLKNLLNPEQNEGLEREKRKLESELRKTFSTREELTEHDPIKAYSAYYKRFTKTYHVLNQLESIVLKSKSIPSVAGLVEAMFMAELKNCLLTAGHDYQTLKLPLLLDVATGNEQYPLMNGRIQNVKHDDMMIADSQGVISSIIYGPDSRTQMVPGTHQAVFIVYAPPGITQEEVSYHLSDIYSYVKIVSPEAKIELQQVFR